MVIPYHRALKIVLKLPGPEGMIAAVSGAKIVGKKGFPYIKLNKKRYHTWWRDPTA
jgi:hypothetical protein